VSTVASEPPGPSIAYRLHARELISQLRTDERVGLTDEEARARLAQHGSNELAAEKPVPAWRRFLSQFQDVLVILLQRGSPLRSGLLNARRRCRTKRWPSLPWCC
jgi:P-type Ca2+ transporter type 2C